MKILLGAFVGAILAFAVGAVVWGFAQVHRDHMHAVPNGEQVKAALTGAKHGVYVMPEWPAPDAKEDAMKAFSEKYKSGPLIYMVVDPDGNSGSEGAMYGKGFAVHFAAALVLALLVAFAGIGSFVKRWIFVVLVAVFAAVYDAGVDWNYWFAPSDWAVRMLVTNVATWAIGGLGIAYFVKPASD